jgi:membrane protein
LGHVLDVNQRVGEVNGGSVASSVTLTVFVSLFPLALAGIAVVGFLAHGNADIPHRIIHGLSLTGSAATTVRNAIATAQRSRKAASIVGFLGLLWSGLGVTTAIGMAVRTPWQVKTAGLRSRLDGLLWLLGAIVIGGAAVALGTLLRFLPHAVAVLAGIGVVLVGLMVEVGFFLWTFWMLGDRRPGWRALLPGSIVGAVGFEALKLGATLYLPRLIANSSSLYGPLGVVFAILAWLALFARLIVFASAENAVRYERNAGTVTLPILAPCLPGDAPERADRGGAAVARTPAPAPAD